MAARSKKLVGPQLLDADAVTLLYTCPAGVVCLVKSARIVNVAGATRSFSLWTSPGRPAGDLFHDATIAAGEVVSDSDWQVLVEGDEIHGLAPAGGVAIRISGAELRA